MILVLAEVVRNTNNVTENKKYKGGSNEPPFFISLRDDDSIRYYLIMDT